MRVIAIDSGSAYTKAVLREDGVTVSRRVHPTSGRPAETAEDLRRGMGSADLVVSTGYGRRLIPAERVVNEITALGVGAGTVRPSGTVIDIGGQDSKVLRLAARGRVEDFVMNDRCAAGTGRFLEVMSRALALPIEEMGTLSLEATAPVMINSLCTVFAESEVISYLSQGQSLADVVAGVYLSIARRIAGMVARTGLSQPVILVGGAAVDRGVLAALGKVLETDILVPPDPQFITALGAALVAEQGS